MALIIFRSAILSYLLDSNPGFLHIPSCWKGFACTAGWGVFKGASFARRRREKLSPGT
jgi:hypothetical protein